MRLSSKYFDGCGFPEEYLFWFGAMLILLLVLSLIMITLTVKEEFMDKVPLRFGLIYIFNSKVYTKTGNIFRIIFFIVLPMVVSFEFLFLKMYEIGWLSCGSEYLFK